MMQKRTAAACARANHGPFAVVGDLGRRHKNRYQIGVLLFGGSPPIVLGSGNTWEEAITAALRHGPVTMPPMTSGEPAP